VSGKARQRKPAEDRKAEIVAAAIRLAAERGPDRVSAQVLAEAVGLSQPAIFRHFATKAEIWEAVGREITAAMGAAMPVPAPGQARAALAAAVAANLAHIAANPAIPAILFSRELHAENEALRAHFAAVTARRREGFARLIGQAQAEAGTQAGMAPEDGAALILAAIQGLAMRWSLEARGFDLVTEGRRLLHGLISAAVAPGEAGAG